MLIILILSKLTEKHPLDTLIKMAFIKEESEDIRIAEVFSIKHEDTEEQTGWFLSQSWTQSFDSYSQYSSTEMTHIYEECHMIFLIMAFIWPGV